MVKIQVLVCVWRLKIRKTCIELFPIFFRWRVHFAIWRFGSFLCVRFFSSFLVRSFVVTSLNTCFNSFKNATNENNIFFPSSVSFIFPDPALLFHCFFYSFSPFLLYFSFLWKFFSICSFHSLNTHAFGVLVFFLPSFRIRAGYV